MIRSRYLLVIPVLALSACKGGGESGSQTSSTAAPAVVQNPVDPATAGSITGTVKFAGTAPKPVKISMAADAYCKTAHTTDVYNNDIVVNPNNTLKWVYIHIKSGLDPALKFPTPTEAAVYDQTGCMYSPHVLGVMTNQKIKVRNSDGVLHNINARPANNPGFNIGQPVKGMESEKSFPNAEVMVPVKCDVHPWMSGFIGVQDNPYFAVTGDDGSFTLPNLPPGNYEIEAWHEKYGSSVQKVTVGAKETKTIEFTFKGA